MTSYNFEGFEEYNNFNEGFDSKGFENDFFDFNSADALLSSLSGPQNDFNQLISPASLNDEEWSQNIANSSDNTAQGVSNTNGTFQNQSQNQSNFDNAYQQNLYDVNNNYTEANNSSSVSSQNDSSGMTPVSQHSLSSTQTTPEPTVKLEPKSGSLVSESEEPLSKRASAINSTKGKVSKTKRNKTLHNMIERKYRTNINSKILMLRDAVPALRIASGSTDVKVEDLEGLMPALKLNKASVLTKATEYIQHLEKKNEMLRQQNLHLQRLIQQANLGQPVQPQQVPSQFAPEMSQNSSHSSNHQSYGDNSVYNGPNFQPSPPNKPNRYLLGAMSAVVGTSLLGGADSDFRGLSAVPFVPFSVTHPPAIVAQFWYLAKVLLVLGCLAQLVLPGLFQVSKNPKKVSGNLLKTWLLVSLGLQLPEPVDSQRKQAICNKLLGKAPEDWSALFADYFYLLSCESTFETCFLTLLVGGVLIHKYPFLQRILGISMNLRLSLLSHLDYKGTESSLVLLNKLVKQVDGVSLFNSKDLFTRIVNVMAHQPTNQGVENPKNPVKYIELYKQNDDDLYNVVFSWRVLENMDQLNELFLENLLIEDDEEQLSKNSKLFKDLKCIGTIISQDNKTSTPIGQYYKLFETVLLPQTRSVEYAKYVAKRVATVLQNFKLQQNGLELTDDEIISEDDLSEGEYDHEHENANQSAEYPDQHNQLALLASQKRLINSLNLVGQEQFVVLTCSLVCSLSTKNKPEAIKLLEHLKFGDDKVPLTILGFTALFKVLSLLITADVIADIDSGSNKVSFENLDKLVRVTRLWLNDNELVMSDELRGKLSDKVVSKGIVLNGGADDHSDE